MLFQIRDFRSSPTLSLLWLGNGAPEKLIDLPKIMQVEDSRMGVKTNPVSIIVPWHMTPQKS